MRLAGQLPGPVRRALLVGAVACAAAPLVLTGPAATAAATAAAAVPPQPAGQAEHWGAFFGDQNPADIDKNKVPVSIALPGPIAQIGTSNSTEYALLTDGTLYAWGQGTNGELGNGGTQNSFTTAVQVQFPPGVQIASIPTDVMPFDTGLAVDTAGNVWGWGLNKGGELCLGNSREFTTPVQLPLTDVTTLAGANGHALYDAGGTVFACGTNFDGELGDGSTATSKIPVAVQQLDGQQVTALVASFNNSGALLADGTYLDWGFDGGGQLGNGTAGQSSTVPVQVPLPLPVTQVAQGGSDPTNGHTLVMLSDGSLRSWGDDSFCQLGDKQTTAEASAVRFLPPRGVTYQTLATGGRTSYAISVTGDVYAWGGSNQGQVGDGLRHTQKNPVLVLSGATLISSTASNVAVSVPVQQA
ncbi:MAG TPA: hypothetical protein VGL63_09965 [Streptosporangiaceae bacterium]